MAQGRFTSRTIAIDPKLGLLSETAEFLYLKAIPHLDRDGLCTGEPYGLLGLISPLRFSQLQNKIAGCIDEWIARELVIRYQTSMGPVLFFLGFPKQQKLQYEREAASAFAAPPGYLRTNKGLVKATEVPWTADSRVLSKTLESEAKTPESRPQAEAEAKAEGKAKAEDQDQGQGQGQREQAGVPAAGGQEVAVREALQQIGVNERVVDQLAGCPLDLVMAWIDYSATQDRLKNRAGYVVARLRSGESPPHARASPGDADLDDYEELKRKYIPPGWEDIIEH